MPSSTCAAPPPPPPNRQQPNPPATRPPAPQPPAAQPAGDPTARQENTSGDPFLAAVVTRGIDVHTVAHIGPKPSTHQDTALQWRDPYCTAQSCNRTGRLQRDHREDWATTHITALTLLDRLCPHDHYLKTHHGWSLTTGKAKRPFVPPDDPRHPNNTPARDGPREGVA